MSNETDESLWNFATCLYQQEAVKETCLRLQDSAGASVNVILWLAWLASTNVRLKPAALSQALQAIGTDHLELVKSLRQARTHLKSANNFTRVQSQMIRKHILAAELSAEKVMLQRLQDLTQRLPKADAAEECLTLFDYLQSLNLSNAAEQASALLEHSRFQQACQADEATTLH